MGLSVRPMAKRAPPPMNNTMKPAARTRRATPAGSFHERTGGVTVGIYSLGRAKTLDRHPEQRPRRKPGEPRRTTARPLQHVRSIWAVALRGPRHKRVYARLSTRYGAATSG